MSPLHYFLSFVFLILSSIGYAQPRLVLDNVEGEVGDVVSIDVRLQGVDANSAYDSATLRFYYDNTILELIDPLSSGINTTGTIFSGNLQVGEGYPNSFAVPFPEGPYSKAAINFYGTQRTSNGFVASLNFRIKKAGETQVFPYITTLGRTEGNATTTIPLDMEGGQIDVFGFSADFESPNSTTVNSVGDTLQLQVKSNSSSPTDINSLSWTVGIDTAIYQILTEDYFISYLGADSVRFQRTYTTPTTIAANDTLFDLSLRVKAKTQANIPSYNLLTDLNEPVSVTPVSVSVDVFNTPPVAAELNPKVDSLIIANDGRITTSFSWSESSDEENDDITYTLLIGTDSTDVPSESLSLVFSPIEFGSTNGTSLDISYTELESILFSLGVQTGETGTLLYQVKSSDGTRDVYSTIGRVDYRLELLNIEPTFSGLIMPATDTSIVFSKTTNSEEIAYEVRWAQAVDPNEDSLSYRYELASDSLFTTILLTKSQTDTSLSLLTNELDSVSAIGLDESVDLFQRVAVIETQDADTLSVQFSAYQKITVERVNATPIPGSITNPLMGSEIRLNGLPSDTALSFSWEAGLDADPEQTLTYVWQLSTQENFNELIDSVSTAAPSLSLTNEAIVDLMDRVSLEDSVELFTRVAYSDGLSSVFSESVSFQLVKGIVNTPPTAASLILPENLGVIQLEGEPSQSVAFSWSGATDADGDTLTYILQIYPQNATAEEGLQLTTTDTTLNVDFGSLQAITTSNVTVATFNVITTDGLDSLLSDSRSVILERGTLNAIPTEPTFVSPLAFDTLFIEGLPTDSFEVRWTASIDTDNDALSYSWTLDRSNTFNSPLLDTTLTDTVLKISFKDLKGVLEARNIEVGDTLRYFHKVGVTDGTAEVEIPTETVFIVLGVVNTPPSQVQIVRPEDGATLVVEGDPEAAVVVEWTAATDEDGDSVFYRWELATDTLFSEASTLFSFTDIDSLTVALNTGVLANLLDQNQIEAGASLDVYHRVRASDGISEVLSPVAQVRLTRGTLTSLDTELPQQFILEQNYPNPFNPSTSIAYSIPQSGRVQLVVYDISGREMMRLVDGVQAAGTYQVSFDASTLSSGIYIYRMVSGDFVQVRKMTLIK